ncbi:MAG: hypothetical protein IPG87_10685 [Saprospiraceae bacterium]|nr:hypothetical protein [Candidatus Vicinibacter affinis]
MFTLTEDQISIISDITIDDLDDENYGENFDPETGQILIPGLTDLKLPNFLFLTPYAFKEAIIKEGAIYIDPSGEDLVSIIMLLNILLEQLAQKKM